MAKPILTPEERFMAKVEPEPMSGCWLWTACCNERGYGMYYLPSSGSLEKIGAHRAAWLLFRGPIPAGLHVLHSCDVRSCVNPDHLRTGTQQDNLSDMAAKQRGTTRPGALYGVHVHPDKGRARRFAARVKIHTVSHYLGHFATAEEAHQAALLFKSHHYEAERK